MHKKLLKFKNRQTRLHHKRVRRLKILGRHPIMVPIITLLSLAFLTSMGFLFFHGHAKPVPNAYVVILSYDHHEQTVPSREPTVGALLKKLNIPLNEGDVVEPATTTPIKQEDFRINIYRAVPVEIVDGGKRTFTFSAATTPRSVASQAGVATYAEDRLEDQPSTNFLAGGAIGQQVVINRATPVSLNLYGSFINTRTRAATVGALIREKNVKLAKDDQVTPAADTPITAGTQVTIARNGTKIETVTEQIAAPVQVIQDNSLAFGTSAVRQQGAAGEKVTTYQNNLVNGAVVSRSAIQTVVTREPVTSIVVQGTNLSGIKANMALVGIAPSDYNYVDYIISHESGWCPTKAQGQYGACPVYAGFVPATGGYGLCQSTPGNKMATAGADWATNPVTQLRWCNGYALARYGSWGAAYNYWLAHHNW